mmetsp:Transcript_21954/g.31823  ORF Transcript_21954/g.31823 Transcript_21954/m.31823 type:complete len:122 (-) Transcript_21954:2156-2521(-)
MGMAIANATGCCLWIWLMRNNKKILASQPEFLCVLCFGSAVTAASIAMISFDESYGWSVNALAHGCKALPWCFFIGYLIMYGAIFSKVSLMFFTCFIANSTTLTVNLDILVLFLLSHWCEW